MSELRYNYLWDTWSVIAPERERRPHDYPVHAYMSTVPPEKCPFEPGKEKITPHEIFAIREPGTEADSPGWKVRVIPNKYPALRIENPPERKGVCIYDKVGGFGAHEIVIETPDHYKTFFNFSQQEVELVLKTYRERIRSLSGDKRISYILVFKNYGRDAGASISHSHSQIIATPQIPEKVEKVIEQSRKYYAQKRRCYLCDEVNFELNQMDRVVYENEEIVVYCPFASLFPFQMKLTPKKHKSSFQESTDEEIKLIADALRQALKRLYKALVNPPYNFFIHTSPPKRERADRPNYFKGMESFFHWYIEIIPRISIPAGFEFGSGYYINPTSPETAAKFLREVVL
ncbi:galactose-1-phosphate uridylyltransferase [Thermovibrio sp.]